MNAAESDAAAAKVAVGPRVSKLDIEGKIVAVNWVNAADAFEGALSPVHPSHALLTICVITLRNGFTVVGTSACAYPQNFDQDLGNSLAYDKAYEQLWLLEGYLLKEQLSNGLIEKLARTAHEANRAYCASLGDDSQLPWDEAPDWQKSTSRAGVIFHIANPDADDAASHQNWTIQKLTEGWTYGPEKDPDNKLHPCLVPFDQLPPAQQFKDRLFRTIVRSFVR